MLCGPHPISSMEAAPPHPVPAPPERRRHTSGTLQKYAREPTPHTLRQLACPSLLKRRGGLAPAKDREVAPHRPGGLRVMAAWPGSTVLVPDAGGVTPCIRPCVYWDSRYSQRRSRERPLGRRTLRLRPACLSEWDEGWRLCLTRKLPPPRPWLWLRERVAQSLVP